MEPTKEQIEELESHKRLLNAQLGKFVKNDPMEAVRMILRLSLENDELKEKLNLKNNI